MLQLFNISKSYRNFRLKDVSFQVQTSDYFVCLGPSGSGKSLLLKIIAGLEQSDKGSIIYNGRDITQLTPPERKFILVFQEDHLFPHLNVYQNLAFAVRLSEKSTLKQKELLLRVAAETMITHLLERKVTTLSGGEKQRVSLARALLARPQILLLDEPLSSVDVQLRSELLQLLKQIHRKGLPIIHVTHDVHEAIALATRMAIMDNGHLLQWGETNQILHKPANTFVAALLGMKNFILCRIAQRDKDHLVAIPQQASHLSIRILADCQCTEAFLIVDSRSIIVSRHAPETSALNAFRGVVREIIPGLHRAEIIVDIGIPLHVSISKESLEALNLTLQQPCWVTFKASACEIVPR